MTILAIAGGAAVALVTDSVHAVRRAAEADGETARASALLDAVALWPREDLDRHLGKREQGAWMMVVGRPTPVLYVVTLSDSSGDRQLLRTTLYRPEETHATP